MVRAATQAPSEAQARPQVQAQLTLLREVTASPHPAAAPVALTQRPAAAPAAILHPQGVPAVTHRLLGVQAHSLHPHAVAAEDARDNM